MSGIYLKPLPKNKRLAPDGLPFTWGPVVKVHKIGDIQIVEYRNDLSNMSNCTRPEEHGMHMFSGYLNNKSTSHSYRTLDSAIVGTIAIKRRGLNSQAAVHFDLMTLGIIPPDA